MGICSDNVDIVQSQKMGKHAKKNQLSSNHIVVILSFVNYSYCGHRCGITQMNNYVMFYFYHHCVLKNQDSNMEEKGRS